MLPPTDITQDDEAELRWNNGKGIRGWVRSKQMLMIWSKSWENQDEHVGYRVKLYKTTRWKASKIISLYEWKKRYSVVLGSSFDPPTG